MYIAKRNNHKGVIRTPKSIWLLFVVSCVLHANLGVSSLLQLFYSVLCDKSLLRKRASGDQSPRPSVVSTASCCPAMRCDLYGVGPWQSHHTRCHLTVVF